VQNHGEAEDKVARPNYWILYPRCLSCLSVTRDQPIQVFKVHYILSLTIIFYNIVYKYKAT